MRVGFKSSFFLCSIVGEPLLLSLKVFLIKKRMLGEIHDIFLCNNVCNRELRGKYKYTLSFKGKRRTHVTNMTKVKQKYKVN